jgi:hypothetical protein
MRQGRQARYSRPAYRSSLAGCGFEADPAISQSSADPQGRAMESGEPPNPRPPIARKNMLPESAREITQRGAIGEQDESPLRGNPSLPGIMAWPERRRAIVVELLRRGKIEATLASPDASASWWAASGSSGSVRSPACGSIPSERQTIADARDALPASPPSSVMPTPLTRRRSTGDQPDAGGSRTKGLPDVAASIATRARRGRRAAAPEGSTGQVSGPPTSVGGPAAIRRPQQLSLRGAVLLLACPQLAEPNAVSLFEFGEGIVVSGVGRVVKYSLARVNAQADGYLLGGYAVGDDDQVPLAGGQTRRDVERAGLRA